MNVRNNPRFAIGEELKKSNPFSDGIAFVLDAYNRSDYPDLNKMELHVIGGIVSKHPELKKYTNHYDVEITAFTQCWSSTAGGFSEPGMFAGQAITTTLTTVMKVTLADTVFYGVFFGNQPAYLVDNANALFLKDLKNKQLKSKYEAGKVY